MACGIRTCSHDPVRPAKYALANAMAASLIGAPDLYKRSYTTTAWLALLAEVARHDPEFIVKVWASFYLSLSLPSLASLPSLPLSLSPPASPSLPPPPPLPSNGEEGDTDRYPNLKERKWHSCGSFMDCVRPRRHEKSFGHRLYRPLI